MVYLYIYTPILNPILQYEIQILQSWTHSYTLTRKHAQLHFRQSDLPTRHRVDDTIVCGQHQLHASSQSSASHHCNGGNRQRLEEGEDHLQAGAV